MVKSLGLRVALLLGIGLGLAFVLPATSRAQDSPDQQNQLCLVCHSSPGMTFTLPSGEKIEAFLNVKNFQNSRHGSLPCQVCHQDKKNYPHAKLDVQNIREYKSSTTQICQTCHSEAYKTWSGSTHGIAAQKGIVLAARCTDCHDVHATTQPNISKLVVSTCSTCHEKVTNTYLDSVHGKALINGNIKAATCASCHSEDSHVHTMIPTKELISLTQKSNIPLLCAKCHTKAQETYKSTLHGRAWRLGKHEEFATCIDCHGSYGVQTAHGAETNLTPEKLAEACAKCHTGADANFASGWMGHEEPSLKHFRIVYITERMFFFLTTTVLAGGLLIVELDLLRWWTNKRKNG